MSVKFTTLIGGDAVLKGVVCYSCSWCPVCWCSHLINLSSNISNCCPSQSVITRRVRDNSRHHSRLFHGTNSTLGCL